MMPPCHPLTHHLYRDADGTYFPAVAAKPDKTSKKPNMTRYMKVAIAFATISLCCMVTTSAGAQEQQPTIDAAWLAYRPVNAGGVFPTGVPDTIVVLGQDPLEQSAAHELSLGWSGMLGREPRVRGRG